jgi:hypothetical protein
MIYVNIFDSKKLAKILLFLYSKMQQSMHIKQS